jgi:NAD(P)H-hydrate epimerase
LILNNHAEWIITPHLGEFSRLSKLSIEYIQSNLTDVALDYAKKFNLICVLKDFHTVIANPDGLSYLNLSGNSGMATAGSGDVLTGIIGSFLAQGMNNIDASSYGVFLHGMAGDTACENMGMRSIMASDIIDGLKEVWSKMENK